MSIPFEDERLQKLEALAKRPGTAGEGQAAAAAICRILNARLPVPPYRPGDLLYSGLTNYPSCNCGSDVFRVEPGTGIHAAKLICARCGKFNKWLRRALVDGRGA